MLSEDLPKIWYGGDYNPEQWDAATMEEDLRMFRLAGIDVVTINVFSWAKSQRDEHTFDFSWLDSIMNRLEQDHMRVCLATSTGAHPAWMAKKYPDILRVDYQGRQRKFGGRHNSCPNSPTYRTYSVMMAAKLAERYKDHPMLAAWHIANEYGGYCYCDRCEAEFRVWLEQRYGTLEKLNTAWNTAFWGHTFYAWDEIVVPNELSEEWGGNQTYFQGISLDYRRFQSDSLLACYQLEYEQLKKVTPNIPITTNMMGTYPELDYFKWAKYMDVISWDNYPTMDMPVSMTSMTHDLMRGLKSGQPFMLMEQTPSQQNWQAYNALKRPGVMRLWSYQAVAHGADTVMFFQLRRSIGACEKYHGAVIEHVGHEHTRVFRETAALGKELQQVGNALIDSRSRNRVAIMFDWENRWAVELSSGPSVALNYVDEVHKYYDALYQLNMGTDMISVEESLDAYDLVIAPVMYMLKPGFAKRIESFVARGGTFVTTFFSGIVNEHDLVTLGGYPGELRNVLGIWAEEIDALYPGQTNSIVFTQELGSLQGSYPCGILCDIIHAEHAEVLAEYGADFYRGTPALTRNYFGKGQAYYVASSPNDVFLQGLLKQLCTEQGIKPLLNTPSGVEVSERVKGNTSYLFVLNHNHDNMTIPWNDEPRHDILTGQTITSELSIAGRGVMILEGTLN
ncbi:beta-galactosidase [Paenibacillus shirakamiensis]|uniref:Beta-galactosidase n=1 Tax=Paenibacillus shirakamiensis TaxID=1265935 RepID=A0ABS4JED2_9BACL|nr:beta-galactosidase [Paenibacillus shirakamiensis]MBP2000072.1 beta-galactosidase [Paenibacillus shirakamiensis]